VFKGHHNIHRASKRLIGLTRNMVEGLPFDYCSSEDQDYALDTTVVSSDDEDEDDCYVEQQEEKDLNDFQLAKAAKAKTIQESERFIRDYMSVIQRAGKNPEAAAKKKSAIELVRTGTAMKLGKQQFGSGSRLALTSTLSFHAFPASSRTRSSTNARKSFKNTKTKNRRPN